MLHVGLPLDELHDLLEAEILVLRHVDRLDVSILDVALLPIEEILEEVDCGVVCIEKRDQMVKLTNLP